CVLAEFPKKAYRNCLQENSKGLSSFHDCCARGRHGLLREADRKNSRADLAAICRSKLKKTTSGSEASEAMLESHRTRELTSFEVLRGPEAGIARWYAIQTIPNHEKKVGQQLGLDGLDVFVPTLMRESRWTDRTKVIEEPIFPGYAFLYSADILG